MPVLLSDLPAEVPADFPQRAALMAMMDEKLAWYEVEGYATGQIRELLPTASVGPTVAVSVYGPGLPTILTSFSGYRD